MIPGFRKTKLYKNPLRIVGGDSKQRNLFSNTTVTTHTQRTKMQKSHLKGWGDMNYRVSLALVQW